MLRPFEPGDAEDLFEIYSRPEVARYLYSEPWDRRETEGHLRQRIAQSAIRTEGDRLSVAAVLRSTNRVIGDLTLKWLSKLHRQGEIGYSFTPAHHGHGFATEGAEAIVEFGFRELGLHRVIGRCDARNSASVGVLERLGMRREAHLVHNEFFKGVWGDELVYAMTEDEWRPRAPQATASGDAPAGRP